MYLFEAHHGTTIEEANAVISGEVKLSRSQLEDKISELSKIIEVIREAGGRSNRQERRLEAYRLELSILETNDKYGTLIERM